MNLHPLSGKYAWLAPSLVIARDLDALGFALLFYDGEEGEREKGGHSTGEEETESNFGGRKNGG